MVAVLLFYRVCPQLHLWLWCLSIQVVSQHRLWCREWVRPLCQDALKWLLLSPPLNQSYNLRCSAYQKEVNGRRPPPPPSPPAKHPSTFLLESGCVGMDLCCKRGRRERDGVSSREIIDTDTGRVDGISCFPLVHNSRQFLGLTCAVCSMHNFKSKQPL